MVRGTGLVSGGRFEAVIHLKYLRLSRWDSSELCAIEYKLWSGYCLALCMCTSAGVDGVMVTGWDFYGIT